MTTGSNQVIRVDLPVRLLLFTFLRRSSHTHTHFYSLSEEQMEAVSSHNSYIFRFDSLKTCQFSTFGFWCTLRVKNGIQRYRQCVHPKNLKTFPLLISRSTNTLLEGHLVTRWRNKKKIKLFLILSWFSSLVFPKHQISKLSGHKNSPGIWWLFNIATRSSLNFKKWIIFKFRHKSTQSRANDWW